MSPTSKLAVKTGWDDPKTLDPARDPSRPAACPRGSDGGISLRLRSLRLWGPPERRGSRPVRPDRRRGGGAGQRALAKLAALVLLGSATTTAQAATDEIRAVRGCTQAERFHDTAYYLGNAHAGTPLRARVRRCEPRVKGEPGRANYQGYTYDCRLRRQCGGRVEVQSWPACERNAGSYTYPPGYEPAARPFLSIRGVPAQLYEDDTRLEVYTGRTTVVIFASSRVRAVRAARVLRSARGQRPIVRPKERLRPPAPGAMEDRLRC